MKQFIEAINTLDKRIDELNDLKNTNNYKIREAQEFIEIIQNDNNNNFPNAELDIKKLTDDIEYRENEIWYKEKRLREYESMIIDLYTQIMTENNYITEADAIKSIKYNYVQRSNLLCSLLDKFVGVTTV